MSIKRTVFTVLLTIATVIVASPAAMAQTRAGARAGIGADPEQFYFGVHADLTEVVPKFWFRPNAEVGVGDGLTVVALNAEFVYRVPLQTARRWDFYFGGGPAAVIRTFRTGPSGRDSDAGPGFNFLMGLQQPRGLLTEVKIGALDSPGFKLGIGWTW
jgi:hypothetical protein